jgi:hypothetical protein
MVHQPVEKHNPIAFSPTDLSFDHKFIHSTASNSIDPPTYRDVPSKHIDTNGLRPVQPTGGVWAF